MFATTFNTPPLAYNLAPSSSCYRPSLPIQIRDMGHEDEDKDEDNNNNNDKDDDNSGDHVPQQQRTITREHPRIRGGRDHRPRGQQTQTNPVQQDERQIQTNSVQQDERPRCISKRTPCGTSSHH